MTCVFLGYLWKVARALNDSPHATVVTAGIEPQRARSADAARYFREHAIPFFEVDEVAPFGRLEEALNRGADLLVVGSFGRVLPTSVLNAARLGALNVHCSLLPAYRGRRPIEEQLRAGERCGGVTLHWMTDAVDAGPIAASAPSPISPADTYVDVFERCHAHAEHLLADLLTRDPSGWPRHEQPVG